MKKSIFFLLFLLALNPAFAIEDTLVIPIFRQLFHDKIDNEQAALDRLDGRIDGKINLTTRADVNQVITDVMKRKIDELQEFVEKSTAIKTNNEKIRNLSFIEQLVRAYRYGVRLKELNPAAAPQLFAVFESTFKANIDSQRIAPIINKATYAIAKIISEIFADNIDYAENKKILFKKYCVLNPDKILQSITPYIDEPFADTLIVISCRYNPTAIYTVAQAVNSKLGQLLHRNNNPLVKTVVELTKTPNALLYFPFLDDILTGKKTLESIRPFVTSDSTGYDSVGYFKLLVKTEIDYYKRMAPPLRDTPIAMFGTNGLRETLKFKAIQHFINPINNLHDLSNINQRMQATDSLSSIDLYYMMVMGESDIYTSSYKHSFLRLVQRLGKTPRTDSLLLNVHFDFFKKFIKMAANYNKLDEFFKYMPTSASEALMHGFIANLDNTGNLEDAIDVADSYSSITDKNLQKTILSYITENENRCIKTNNNRGKVIYGLLKTIFLSADPGNKTDLTSILGIPSIYEIENKDLVNENGRVIQQVYWYGDKDGKTFFPMFINSFSARDWVITYNDEWYEIKSKNDKVWIYANRPLDNDANLDDSAQIHLNDYLSENSLHPAVVVHRGHSYWLSRTIKRMSGDAKIVVLGSCGGYKNLNDIIEVNPEAHIISTKEIGTGDINRPILNYLNQTFESGRILVWKDMWNSLSKLFNNDSNRSVRESWDDYIPPYKNLGAIFLKGYNNMIMEE